MNFEYTSAELHSLEKMLTLEWIETNGLGGWASTTVSGTHTRSYHGLLVAATKPPTQRHVLVSRLDESVQIAGQVFELSTRKHPGAVHPHGYKLLRSFARGTFPVWEYGNDDFLVRKTIAALHGENTVVLLYELLRSKQPLKLSLRPFIAARGYHALMQRNDAFNIAAPFSDGLLSLQPYQDLPCFWMCVPCSTFEHKADWYYRFEYDAERMRGLAFQEDLFTPGTFEVALKQPGDEIGVMLSCEKFEARDARKALEAEERRRGKLLAALPIRDEITEKLAQAADQFIVSRGDKLKTILAGYHWFTDWGRDTMIALPGLTLVTGRHKDAKSILETFAKSFSEGMIPNRFPDHGESVEYNTVDATLWFFVAVKRYLEYTGDLPFVRKVALPALLESIQSHRKGTRYNICIDTDGLVSAGEHGVQLTWMDAKVGKWVVTPRRGKPVEVNALWYNALSISAELCELCKDTQLALSLTAEAARVKKVFRDTFWNEGSLFDCVHGAERDGAIRPNQIFALSLPYPLLDKQDAHSVLRVVEEKLLTPMGLRTLDPGHRDYRGRYSGDQLSRDGAYHQGTVWPWLLGPYITALVRFEGEAGRVRARRIIDGFLPHLREGCVGSISEIFDGDLPHTPRGSVSQAWSVAEILRAYVEDVLGKGPKDL